MEWDEVRLTVLSHIHLEVWGWIKSLCIAVASSDKRLMISVWPDLFCPLQLPVSAGCVCHSSVCLHPRKYSGLLLSKGCLQCHLVSLNYIGFDWTLPPECFLWLARPVASLPGGGGGRWRPKRGPSRVGWCSVIFLSGGGALPPLEFWQPQKVQNLGGICCGEISCHVASSA